MSLRSMVAGSFLALVALGCGAEPRRAEPRRDPEPPAADTDRADTPGADPAAEGPPRCPEGTHAVLVQERRCAPCAMSASPCPCSPATYRCEPIPAPIAATGVACGDAACAAAEACCTIDCAGAIACRPRAACPALECGVCPAGTCRRREGGPCETPTGQTGNACCGCGADGFCSNPCRCAALDTPVDTPAGPRAIADLAPGDLVISVDRGRRRAVPILRVHRARAVDHHVVRVVLESGAVLRMSPGHPTADGRTFGALRAGDRLDGVAIVATTLEPYELPETADILPASDTGAYLAAGVLVGSTLTAGAPAAE